METNTKINGDKESLSLLLNSRLEVGKSFLNYSYISKEELAILRQKWLQWDDINKEILKKYLLPKSNKHTDSYLNLAPSYRTIQLAAAPSHKDVNPDVHDKSEIQDRLDVLDRIINLLDYFEESDVSLENISTHVINQENKRIFLVHGHDEGMKNSVSRVLEKLDLEPIILNEQASKGKTIIEKFEEYSNVGFAIILLSSDDWGNAKNEKELNLRARQNVIFEMGYFHARLGRNRVMNLQENGVEIPSDLSGIVYTKFDSKGWKLDLVKELIAAGYDIDLSKII